MDVNNRAAADVVVIGGGLAGLMGAAHLARAGRSVELIERASELGGRARTQERGGFFTRRKMPWPAAASFALLSQAARARFARH